MRAFGSSLERHLARQPQNADTFVCWSSFALETLRAQLFNRTCIVRNSSHIEFQREVLLKEYLQFGVPLQDHAAVIDRENEEYALADEILVLSEFARRTFLQRGVPPSKLKLLRLGVDTRKFVPRGKTFNGGSLRVLYFGAISIRKGIHYLLDAVEGLSDVELTLIGPVEETFRPRLETAIRAGVQYLKPLSQDKLAIEVAEHDVFVMPTLEDGFGSAVIQAMSAGLVPISTDRCGASERIAPNKTGFQIPAGKTEPLRELLQKLRDTPSLVQQVQKSLLSDRQGLTWDLYRKDVAHWVSDPVARLAFAK
jgi:glycosyltransferase involved in cell wall biosynthesis